MNDFNLSLLLILIVSWSINGFHTDPKNLFAVVVSALITTVLMFILMRILFSTKVTHFMYWLLRTVGLRKKAKIVMVKHTKKGVRFKIDKLDPGEKLEVGLLIPVKKKKK